MIEGQRSGPGPKTEDETVESTALAGAVAIQRIITDRDNIRNWASAQHREIAALKTENETLRRRVVLIRQNYLELATGILGQVERFDEALREIFEEDPKKSAPSDDSILVDLAQRLSPAVRNSAHETSRKPKGTSA
jgi:predicted  nucleic acid-binding Zn-ribbon protein